MQRLDAMATRPNETGNNNDNNNGSSSNGKPVAPLAVQPVTRPRAPVLTISGDGLDDDESSDDDGINDTSGPTTAAAKAAGISTSNAGIAGAATQGTGARKGAAATPAVIPQHTHPATFTSAAWRPAAAVECTNVHGHAAPADHKAPSQPGREAAHSLCGIPAPAGSQWRRRGLSSSAPRQQEKPQATATRAPVLEPALPAADSVFDPQAFASKHGMLLTTTVHHAAAPAVASVQKPRTRLQLPIQPLLQVQPGATGTHTVSDVLAALRAILQAATQATSTHAALSEPARAAAASHHTAAVAADTTLRQAVAASARCARDTAQLITAARQSGWARFGELLRDAANVEQREQQALQRAVAAAAHDTHVALVRHARVRAWLAADLAKAERATGQRATQAAQAHAAQVATARSNALVRIQPLLQTWRQLGARYATVLQAAIALADAQLAAADTSPGNDSVVTARAAGSLLRAVHGIVQDALQAQPQDPEDALQVLRTLQHAVRDTAATVEQLCGGAGPAVGGAAGAGAGTATVTSVEDTVAAAQRRAAEAQAAAAGTSAALVRARAHSEALLAATGTGVEALLDAQAQVAALETALAEETARAASAVRAATIARGQLASGRVQALIARLNGLGKEQSQWLAACSDLETATSKLASSIANDTTQLDTVREASRKVAEQHVERLQAATRERMQALDAVLLQHVSTRLQQLATACAQAATAAADRRAAIQDQVNRVGELYCMVSAGGAGVGAATLAALLNQFRGAFAEITQAHDATAAAQVAYLHARTAQFAAALSCSQ